MKKQAPHTLYGSLNDLREMGLHPITLLFPKHIIESSFRTDFYTKSVPAMRFSLMIAILFYGFFGILDIYLISDVAPKLLLIRFGAVIPFLIAIILFSYSSHFRHFSQAAMTSVLLVCGSGIIYMTCIIPSPFSYFYYAGLILVLIWGYTFLRMRFIWATMAGWLIVLSYQLAATGIADTPSYVLISNNFFLIGANIAGMLACYSIELYARRDFFLT